MPVCPKPVIIRRTMGIDSDRLFIIPTDDSIASIEKIIVNIDEPVTIVLLDFHTKNRAYCSEYKIDDAQKRICDLAIKYIQFYFSIAGYSPDKSEYLIAFLLRTKNNRELYGLVNKMFDVAEWLEIKQKVNCLVFRYGPPVHSMDNIKHWQKELEMRIKETKEMYFIHQVDGKIKHVSEKTEKGTKNRSLVISNNHLFEGINVS